MMADARYLETLLLYYEEEVEGEAYFAELARMFDTPDHSEKLSLLAEVERHAATGVQPLIEKYGLTPRPQAELAAAGRADAHRAAVDWPALLAEMNQSYPGYLEAFQKLEEMAPKEDRPRLSFLTQHEVAALDFLSQERASPNISAQPLRDYLATAPEAWAQSVG